MKNRYDGTPSKDAALANVRQSRMEAEHSAKDSFVKKQQNELAQYSGKMPDLKPESMKFNSYMCNNGQNAQEFARDLTKSLDKVAYPVK